MQKKKTFITFAPQIYKVMKRIYILLSVLLALSVVSCKNEQKQASQEEMPKTETSKAPSINESESYTMDDTVHWQGKVYSYSIVRKADKESDVIVDEEGKKYYDNIAEVTITRPDGSVFYSHTFGKSAFSQYLSERLKEYGILEGLVFEDATSSYIQLAASVALPQSDEYMPFAVRISTGGGVSIVKVNRMLEE